MNIPSLVGLICLTAMGSGAWAVDVGKVTAQAYEQLQLAGELHRDGKNTRAEQATEKAIKLIHQVFRPGSRFKATSACRFRKVKADLGMEPRIVITCAHQSLIVEVGTHGSAKQAMIKFEDLADGQEFLGIIEVDRGMVNKLQPIHYVAEHVAVPKIEVTLVSVMPAPPTVEQQIDAVEADAPEVTNAADAANKWIKNRTVPPPGP